MKETTNNESLLRSNLLALKQILSFNEALLYLDVSKSFLYKQTSNKTMKFTKPNGGKLYFRKSDLDAWMMQNESNSSQFYENELLKHLEKNGKKTIKV